MKLLSDGLQLLGVPLLYPLEDVGEEFTEEVQDLEVVLLDHHLQIEAYELAHMAVSEGVFCAEDRSDFKDSLEIGHHAHLLVELGRLGQTGLAVKVAELEDVAASLGTTSNELGSVDLDEVVVYAELPEELTDSRGKLEDGLLGGRPKVYHPVVEASLHAHRRIVARLLFNLMLLRLFSPVLVLLVRVFRVIGQILIFFSH